MLNPVVILFFALSNPMLFAGEDGKLEERKNSRENPSSIPLVSKLTPLYFHKKKASTLLEEAQRKYLKASDLLKGFQRDILIFWRKGSVCSYFSQYTSENRDVCTVRTSLSRMNQNAKFLEENLRGEVDKQLRSLSEEIGKINESASDLDNSFSAFLRLFSIFDDNFPEFISYEGFIERFDHFFSLQYPNNVEGVDLAFIKSKFISLHTLYLSKVYILKMKKRLSKLTKSQRAKDSVKKQQYELYKKGLCDVNRILDEVLLDLAKIVEDFSRFNATFRIEKQKLVFKFHQRYLSKKERFIIEFGRFLDNSDHSQEGNQ